VKGFAVAEPAMHHCLDLAQRIVCDALLLLLLFTRPVFDVGDVLRVDRAAIC